MHRTSERQQLISTGVVRDKVIHVLRSAAIAALMLCAVSPAALAAAASPEDGPVYHVNQLFMEFAEDLPVHPPTKLMMQLDVTLGVTDTGYVSPREGLDTVTVKLSEIPKLTKHEFHRSAINEIAGAVVEHFTEWGYAGITVVPHEEDVDPVSGQDIRLEGQTAMRLMVRSMTGRGRPMRVGPVWEAPDSRDGVAYVITQFIIDTAPEVGAAVDAKRLLNTSVVLGESEEGLFSTRDGARQVQVRILDVPRLGNHTFYNSALYDVCAALTAELSAQGRGDLYVWPSPKDMDASGQDVRLENQTALRLLVQPGQLPPKPVYVVIKPPVVIEQPIQIAQEDLPEAVEEDGMRYPVSQIIMEYQKDHAGLPELSVLMNTPLQLTEVKGGYVAPRAGEESTFSLRVADLPTLRQDGLYGSAIRYINQRLVTTLNEHGFIGVYVAPNPDDIAPDGADVRPETQTALRMEVQTGLVSEIRTIAQGERIPLEERLDNPKHERLKRISPVVPGGSGEEGDATDLLYKKALDEYVYRMSRHPGRRLDVAVSPGMDPGTINLDLLVTENKPWVVYAQASNTGTKQTSEWRERFGFIHNQLTNHDDVLSLDYITASFEFAHALIGSYEFPLSEDPQILRARVNGTYSEFTASDVGLSNTNFTGEEWSAGGDVIWNIWQENQQFVDLIGGAKWQHVKNNESFFGGPTNESGEDSFFLPHIGLEYENITNTHVTLASVDYEVNAPGVAGTDAKELNQLGRIDADTDGMVMRFDILQSFYLEPLLNYENWADPSDPSDSTLAHEIVLSLRGQYAFDTRLNPQRERTVGGLYSVRGYDESIAAADTAVIATVEYRFHFPRILAPSLDPGTLFGKTMKWRPQYVFQRPDWDLFFRAFVDYGATINSGPRPTFEDDQELLSTGVGVEFLLKRNLSLRVDWGFVLKDLDSQGNTLAEVGDNRVHFVGTLLY